jgi:hypothetical protein
MKAKAKTATNISHHTINNRFEWRFSAGKKGLCEGNNGKIKKDRDIKKFWRENYCTKNTKYQKYNDTE